MEEVIKEYAHLGALGIVYLLLEIIKAVKKWREERQQKVQTDPALLMKKKNVVENYCHVILAETHAAHVAVYRYHNGTFYAGGDSIKFASLYAEAAILEELHVDTKGASIPLIQYSQTFAQMLERDIVVVERDQAADWHLNKLMAERQQTYKILMILRGPDKVPIGSLAINFMNHDVHWKEVKSEMLYKFKQQLEYKLA